MSFPYDDELLDEKGVFKLVYCGSMGDSDSLDEYLDAMKGLEERGISDVRLVLFGDGPRRAELERRCMDENIAGVFFRGRVKKRFIPSIVSRADANVISVKDTGVLRYGCSFQQALRLFSGRPAYRFQFPIGEKRRRRFRVRFFGGWFRSVALRRDRPLARDAFEGACGCGPQSKCLGGRIRLLRFGCQVGRNAEKGHGWREGHERGSAVKRPCTVLMTGAGAPGAYGIIQCLRFNGERDIRIVGVDMNPAAGCRDMVDVFRTVPPASDARFPEEILRISREEAVDVVLPIVTRELMPLAKAKPAFVEKGIAVCVMDPEPLALANDKAALLSFCRDQGLPTPEFRVADTADEVERALDEMGCDRRALYVKAAQGNGSRGVRYVDPLVSRFDRFFNEKPDSAFMSKEDIMLALRERDAIPRMLVMEALPGVEYSADIVADEEGNILCSAGAQKSCGAQQHHARKHGGGRAVRRKPVCADSGKGEAYRQRRVRLSAGCPASPVCWR